MKTLSLKQATQKGIKALCSILLRHGVSYADFAEWTKEVFVEAAVEHFKKERTGVSQSRISAMTGINRKEIARLLSLEFVDTVVTKKPNRLEAVINGWLTDPEFLTKDGEPRDLTLEDEQGGFGQLVKRYGADVPHKAILIELDRIGATTRAEGGNVRLVAKGYVPTSSPDEMIQLMGQSLSDITHTLLHNLSHPHQESHLQLFVAYDNTSRKTAERFKNLSQRRATRLLMELNRWLDEHEQDDQRESEAPMRIGLGIYYFEDSLEEKEL